MSILKILWKGAYLGIQYSNKEIAEYLDSEKIVYTKLEDEDFYPKVAEYLEQQKIIGWFQGAMEFGPRALGGRSIIGDARSPEMQSKMNLKIKYRESFRPFAPSVLSEKSSQNFELEEESPYMLLVAPVHEEKLKDLKSA